MASPRCLSWRCEVLWRLFGECAIDWRWKGGRPCNLFTFDIPEKDVWIVWHRFEFRDFMFLVIGKPWISLLPVNGTLQGAVKDLAPSNGFSTTHRFLANFLASRESLFQIAIQRCKMFQSSNPETSRNINFDICRLSFVKIGLSCSLVPKGLLCLRSGWHCDHFWRLGASIHVSWYPPN